MFPARIYVERRRRLRAQVGSGVVLLLGNGESPMNYTDNPYPFRQDSTFLYFFGLDSPGLAAVIDIDEDRETVFGDDLTMDDIIWTGPRPPLRERCREVGVADAASFDALEGVLARAAGHGREIHLLPAYRPESVLAIDRLLGIRPAELPDRVSTSLIEAVVAQRSVKGEEEIAEIEAALEICHAMHTTAMKVTRPGMVEREVAGAMEGVALSRGGRLSFPTIFSIHGETLHNHYHGNVMEAGDIVINDSGAESPLHYAGDITRTIPVGGRFTQKQREIYAIVLASQEAALEAIRPGVAFRDVHLLACEILASGLKDLGLMRGEVREAVRAGAHALFFQCGVGHMLGLDVHDMEALGEDYVGYTEAIRRSRQFGLRSLRLGRMLEPGFVITVEPGLYFIPALIDQWKSEHKHSQFIDYDAIEAYRDFGGVRLEDNVLVCETGCRVLGREIPKTMEGVEALLAT